MFLNMFCCILLINMDSARADRDLARTSCAPYVKRTNKILTGQVNLLENDVGELKETVGANKIIHSQIALFF